MKTQKNNHQSFFKHLILIIFVIPIPVLLAAYWEGDPAENAPVCRAPEDQWYPVVCASGTGKAIIVWRDERNETTGSDIYAQRVNIHGEVFWATDGIEVCNAPEDQHNPAVVEDGQGGVIIAWRDSRGDTITAIYAQRMDSSGTFLWADNGIAACTEGAGLDIEMISDGQGGAILAWEAAIVGRNTFFTQHIDSSGQPLWGEDGIHIGGISSNMDPKLTTDGSGGAIFAWTDGRNSSQSNFDIYAQHLNGEGISQWTQDGVAVTRADYGQRARGIVSDMEGGAIILWYDYRWDNGLYTQRVSSSSGNSLWLTDGVAIDSTTDGKGEIISDNAGGAYYFWEDRSFSTDHTTDIYGQRIDASGSPLWGAYGVPVCDHQGYQYAPRTVHDGSGGVILTWNDYRNSDSTSWDIYAQRVNSSGGKMWSTEGVCISNALNSQEYPEIAGCDSLGAIITWVDSRNYDTSGRDIYMQGVDIEGNLYDVPNSIYDHSIEKVPTKVKMYQNYPNPFNPVTTIKYTLPRACHAKLTICNILGQRVASLVDGHQKAGYKTARWDASSFSSGIYFYRFQAGDFVQTRKMVLIR